jgi:hypothetical protein
MKKFITMITISALFVSAGFSQALKDTISIERNAYLYQGEKLTIKELTDILKSNPEAHKEMKKAKSNATGAQIFGYIGGFMIGWPLGTAIGGGDPNWALAGIGVGVALISIPFVSKANNHAKNAVDIYNRDLNTTGNLNHVEYYFHVSSDGIGLRLLF